MPFWKRKQKKEVSNISQWIQTNIDLSHQAAQHGSFHEALRPLNQTLRHYQALANAPQDLSAVLAALSALSAAQLGQEFSQQLALASERMDDPNLLWKAGYQMVGVGLGYIAMAPLLLAHRLQPTCVDILLELCMAFEEAGLHQDAAVLLSQQHALLQQSFNLRYMLGFHAMLAGDVKSAVLACEQLGQPSTSHEEAMQQTLSDFVTRVAAVQPVSSLDHSDLRGWHYVLHGSVVTHLSPYGQEEGMNGRYALVQDSDELCAEGVIQLESVLQAWQCRPVSIVAASDDASRILAQAVSARLGVPMGTSSEGLTLVVAYDLAETDPSFVQAMVSRQVDQIFFCHAVQFTPRAALSPDICTYFYQSNRSPWYQDVQESPGGDSVIQACATRVVKAFQAADALQDKAELIVLATQIAPTVPCCNNLPQRRCWWGEGPVKSGQFY